MSGFFFSFLLQTLLPQIHDHRDRRMLVQVLKRLLQNIATEDVRSEYTRRNQIDMDNMANGVSDNFARRATAG